MTGFVGSGLPDLDVSRETSERLLTLQALILKWTTTINLISKSTAPDIWNRHIIDSAQIFRQAPQDAQIWADLGSGAGLPGLVIACLAAGQNPGLSVTLVESDRRKATFLRQAALQLSLKAHVRAERIEETQPISADVVSARALAPLDILCGYAARHLKPGGIALFHKGLNAEAEIAQAEQHWRFRLTRIESITDASAVILKIEGLTHA